VFSSLCARKSHDQYAPSICIFTHYHRRYRSVLRVSLSRSVCTFNMHLRTTVNRHHAPSICIFTHCSKPTPLPAAGAHRRYRTVLPVSLSRSITLLYILHTLQLIDTTFRRWRAPPLQGRRLRGPDRRAAMARRDTLQTDTLQPLLSRDGSGCSRVLILACLHHCGTACVYI
jgi:hypothetical protein